MSQDDVGTTGRPLRAETSIEIEAPVALVWTVMLDFPSYAEWNPFVVRIDGLPSPPREGDGMRLHVRWRDGSHERSHEEIVRIEAPATGQTGVVRATLTHAFRGPLHALGLVRGSRWHTLEQLREQRTRYHTVEVFRGLLSWFVPLADVQDGFERHARALKARAEALHRTR